jgi:ADP-heptose:LPS heptosyltransferase
MSTRTHRLFLLRAYGDATIALYFLANSPEKNNYTIITSSHLKPLIKALGSYIDLSSLQIQFVDFGITKSQLNLFTNRHLISSNTIRQITKLKQFVKNNPNTGGIDYLEQNNKSALLNLLLGHPFKSVVNKEVYAEMSEFYKATPSISPSNNIINKILIVPDARITDRRIPENLIHYIKTKIGSAKLLQVAYFDKANNNFNKQNELVSYSNFEELLTLINEADFVFGSDSLPIHLCNALQKPHYILYPKNGSSAFFTPFSIANNYYADFEKFTSLYFPI